VVAFSGITEPTRTVRGGPYKGKQIEVSADDNTLLMLDFGQSTFAVVDGTFNVNAAKSPKVELFGRAGTLNIADYRSIRAGAPPIEVYHVDAVPGIGGWITLDSQRMLQAEERHVRLQRALLVDHLVDCISNKSRPVLSAEHARHALEIMLMAVESARTGRAIDLTTSF
jgi:predicted dehydrogenase